jgi:plastocyanin domain-containing protein
MSRNLMAVMAVALALTVAGCGASKSGGAAGGRVAIEVTEDGFVPASVTVTAGQPVTLAITRRTDRTCATEIVMPKMNIERKLPLNETVEVTFTPPVPDTLGYACAMDMIKGQVVVVK